MQLFQLERDDWNFFCPATGQPVFKETRKPHAATVLGVLYHEVPDEPELLCDELKAHGLSIRLFRTPLSRASMW